MEPIITTFMMGLSTLTARTFCPRCWWQLAPLVGSIISTRIMLRFTKRM